MQLMIDTAADTTTLLRRAAKFLTEEADLRDADETTAPAALTAFRPNTLRIPELTATGESAPVVDTAAIFGKQPAGLDGHGANKTTAPAPVLSAVLIAPPPPVSLPLAAPAPPVAVPAASAGIPQPSANPVERDSSGLPYDARIHQTARGKKRDGAWKNQKGIDPALVAAVTAELRNAAGAPPVSVAGPALTAPPPPAASAPVAPPPPASTVAPQPGPVANGAAPVPSGNPFRVLMQTITSNTNTGKLTNDEVDAALKSVGLPPRQLVSLVQNPDKVADVAAYIDAVLAAKG